METRDARSSGLTRWARWLIGITGICCVAGTLVALGGAMPVAAADADALASEAQSLIRSAERDMFGGKKDAALQKLDDAGRLIEELRAADPEHAKLATLDSKYAKIRKDLERRIGKASPAASADDAAAGDDAGDTGDTGEAEGAAPAAETAGGSGSDDAAGDALPAGATKRIKEIDAILVQVDAILDGDAAADKKAKNADYKLGRARGLLEEIATNYGTQIAADHPEYAGVQERVASRQARITAITGELEQAAAEAAAATGEASKHFEADRARVLELYDTMQPKLDLVHGNTMVYGVDVASAQSALDQLDAVESDVMPTLEPALAELAGRYGTDAMTINNLVHSWGIKTGSEFGNRLEWLIEAAQHVPQSRAASAETIARNASSNLDGIERLNPEFRLQRMQQTKDVLVIGQRLDPNNADINSMLATIDQRMSDQAETIEKEIDAASWAGNVKSFAGPGSVDGLAKAALEYFRADRGWGGNPDIEVEILKVAVRGPWTVAEKDIFGQVTRWRLPIHLAVTNPTLRPKNIAKVFELSIVAMEGAGNKAPKEPPFDGFWVGNNWMMRLDRL